MGAVDDLLTQVEGPQQTSAVEALLAQTEPKSVTGFLTNAKDNAVDVAHRFANAIRPDQLSQTAKDLAKTVIGGGELAAGAAGFDVPQKYYQENFLPVARSVAGDLGFTQPGASGLPGWSAAKFGENAYNRPVDVALSASGVVAPFEALPGRVGQAVQAVNRATNPVSLAGRGISNVARRSVTPFPARPAAQKAAGFLANEGVPQTAGQAVGSKALKYGESELGGGPVANVIDAQGEAFTRAASRRIGLDTPHLDGPTMEAAYNRIGNDIGTIAGRNTLIPNQRLMQNTYNAVGEYNRRVPISQRVPLVDQFRQEIQALRGPVPGDVYQDLRWRIGKEARATSDNHVQTALYRMQRALDDTFEAGINPADASAFKTARRQYRNYLVLEGAMATGGQQTAAGILTPAKLEAAASAKLGQRAYLHGRGNDFAALAKAGKVGMSAMPESGTSTRAAVRAVPTIAGALLAGGGGLSPEAMAGALVGLGAPWAAGRAIMSPPMQAYLRNQLLPGPTQLGAIAGAEGRMVSPIINDQQRQY